ncbi:MAG: hypothetical protein ACSLFR_18085 [Solirubrobacteraceae bacterium]
MPTEAQVVYERIEELTAGGMSNADAIRAVAKERGKKENAVRANQHQYRQKLEGGAAPSPRGRGRSARKPAAPTASDAIADARAALERGLAEFDQRVAEAKRELDKAQHKYDRAVAEVKEEKAELESKIKALA